MTLKEYDAAKESLVQALIKHAHTQVDKDVNAHRIVVVLLDTWKAHEAEVEQACVLPKNAKGFWKPWSMK